MNTNQDLPRVAVANDLDVDGITSLVLEQSLDELLVHPVVKLTHPIACQQRLIEQNC